MANKKSSEPGTSSSGPKLRNPRVERVWRIAATDEMVAARIAEERRYLENWTVGAARSELIDALLYFAGEHQRSQIILEKELAQTKAFKGVATTYLGELNELTHQRKREHALAALEKEKLRLPSWERLELFAIHWRDGAMGELKKHGRRQRLLEAISAEGGPLSQGAGKQYEITSSAVAIKHLWPFINGQVKSKRAQLELKRRELAEAG